MSKKFNNEVHSCVMLLPSLPCMQMQGVKQSVLLFVVVVIVVVVHTKITRSQFLGAVVSDQHCHNVENGEKVATLCSNVLDMDHKC